MHHNDVNSSYYQYYQPHIQNPNSSSTPADHPYNPAAVPGQYASAPPVPSDYSSAYPPYSHSSADHFPTANPNAQSSTQQQSCNYYPYNQNQTSLCYDYSTPNPPNYSSSYSSAPHSIENNGSYGEQGFYDSGVYKYNGRKEESYSESRSQSNMGVMFDDYGRPINIQNGRENQGHASSREVVKATPKMEEQQDVAAGVLKFRVKLLSEGVGQSDLDVLCQIGLDGIRILDPAMSRTLRIYLLENVTRWEVLDSYIFAFWAKSSVDVEPRRIRLKSNSYTVNNILDTVTAASIQIKEMGESDKPSDSIKGSEQAAEKKKGFVDLMKLMRPLNEEKDFWVPDEAVRNCTGCGTDFSAFNRKHHCRNCGDIFCDKCTQGRVALTADEDALPVRVCDRCMAEVTQRLSNSKEAMTKVAPLRSHEDLTRKLKEEMDKKRKISAGHSSQGSRRMREVECPTCTVHLQVEVPASGSETIECSICQHPFLVNAH
ncbi:PREDICTED: protein FREE1-like [Nicotiana attenuata]|uniref:Protein free1 n=1 Tax=Nicotiana attenuata TaxID=49451 RepID=A0A1J6IN49_NICAT|nr:PREDICTED: protein FREE1-like [Nicotiana attenuata]OIT05700.1 protein free1 [Nicotiana attenuata]